MNTSEEVELRQLDETHWEIPVSCRKGMRVPGMIIANRESLPQLQRDQAVAQVVNVAHLPGIVRYALAMPDIHWGYGFPIGGVAATDPDEGGVISPGGIGFDINCGVRLIRTALVEAEVRPRLRELVGCLFNRVPCGVGVEGDLHVSGKDQKRMLRLGAAWAVEHGFGVPDDVAHCESGGVLEEADPECVSERAFERGRRQLGTLGSGNHFLEIQYVDEIHDEDAAAAFGLRRGSVTVMIHSGSRGFGYQICEDALEITRRALVKYGICVPDPQLACAPVYSPEGRQYLAAMRCAANYAWNNRQCLTALAREVFERFFVRSPRDLGMDLIYDVAHNIAKFETHRVDGKERWLCVNRKGATRAFAPGHEELPEAFRHLGQPVIIPGDMGRASFLALGTIRAMEDTFGSSCHGAGRAMSRTQAVKAARGRSIESELEARGIIVMGRGRKGIAEEQPDAYKNIADVMDTVCRAGLVRRVLRLRPLGVIKG